MARKEVIQIRCSEIEKTHWVYAASAQQLDLSAWIRLVLTKAAGAPQHQTGTQQRKETFDA